MLNIKREHKMNMKPRFLFFPEFRLILLDHITFVVYVFVTTLLIIYNRYQNILGKKTIKKQKYSLDKYFLYCATFVQ